MSKKVAIPDGMLIASTKAYMDTGTNDIYRVAHACVKWLSENPIVPTHEQCLEIMDQVKPYTLWPELYRQVIELWQRRMFDVPEHPPEHYLSERDIINAWLKRNQTEGKRISLVGDAMAQELLRELEAFQRGKESR